MTAENSKSSIDEAFDKTVNTIKESMDNINAIIQNTATGAEKIAADAKTTGDVECKKLQEDADALAMKLKKDFEVAKEQASKRLSSTAAVFKSGPPNTESASVPTPPPTQPSGNQ